MSTIPELVLMGDAYERGIRHGETFADEIRNNVEVYLETFIGHGADKDDIYDQADRFWPLIKDLNEEYSEEMRGVAEGSGVSIEDVTILNARWEVMYSAFAAEANDGCTSFGLQSHVTSDGHTYMGQNWDWMPDLHLFIMNIQRDDKPNMVAMTETGIVGGKIGVNEHGIGMALNGLITPGDGEDPFQRPYHVRFREQLDSQRLDQAIHPVVREDRANSANFLLGDADDQFIDIEAGPKELNYLYPEDGVITHANHIEGERMESKFEKLIPDTLCRARRLRELLTRPLNEGKTIDLQTIKDAQRDHAGKPASICRHLDESIPETDRIRSNGAFIMDLTDRVLHAVAAAPCENEYQTYEVASSREKIAV